MAETDLADKENEKVLEKVKKFVKDGCGCALGAKGVPCSEQFTEAVVLFNLNNCLELPNDELDLVVLASKQAFTHRESTGTHLLFSVSTYLREMFLHIYGLSDSRFPRLMEHYQNYGFCPTIYSNTKRLPENTLSQAAVEGVRTFRRGKRNLPPRKNTRLQKWSTTKSLFLAQNSCLCCWRIMLFFRQHRHFLT